MLYQRGRMHRAALQQVIAGTVSAGDAADVPELSADP